MGIAKYIKEIGRGKDGARALAREQAADLMGQVLDGQVTDLEIGGFCLAMRIKGETPEEMAGFLDAVHARLAKVQASGPVVVLPSYNGARRLPVLTPLLAALLAREGANHGFGVLMHGCATEDARITSQSVLEALNYQQNKPLAQWNIAQAATNFIVSGQTWPRVDIVHNYVGASGAVVRALLHSTDAAHPPLRGIVVAGTGNGTLASDLQTALLEAQNQGVKVLRASRCAWGGVSATANDVLPCTALSAVKARILLTLQLAASAP
jgi:hypothetical protein